MAGIINLLTNAGNSAGQNIISEWHTWYGGAGQLWVSGDIGGGTVHLEATLDEVAVNCVEGTFIVEASTAIASIVTFNLNHGTKIRAVLEETTSDSSGVNVRVN